MKKKTLAYTANWRKRMREGVLVELKIKRWRARKKLTLQELGIYPPSFQVREAYEQLLSLGSKTLLPLDIQRELDSLERSARYHLREYAFETPFGSFIPYTSYSLWKQGNEEYQRRFFEKRDEIVAQYPELVEQLLREYEQIATHTHTLLMQQVPELMGEQRDLDSFLTHFKNEVIRRNILSAEAFGNSFIYEVEMKRIPLLNMLDTEETTEEAVDADIMQREIEREAEEKKQRMLEEMNRDLVETARQQKKEQIDAFFTSLFAQLRNLVYETATGVLDSLKSQEVLTSRSAIQLKNLVQQVENLNFYGDLEIEALLEQVQAIIDQPYAEREYREIERQLRSIATFTRAEIITLGEQPRTARRVDQETKKSYEVSLPDIGIPEEPTDEEIRQARHELLLESVPALFVEEEERTQRTEEPLEPLLTSFAAEQRSERFA